MKGDLSEFPECIYEDSGYFVSLEGIQMERAYNIYGDCIFIIPIIHRKGFSIDVRLVIESNELMRYETKKLDLFGLIYIIGYGYIVEICPINGAKINKVDKYKLVECLRLNEEFQKCYKDSILL